jgi:hypothetical protein
MTDTFNAVLGGVVIPMHSWGPERERHASKDPVVLDTRILLLLRAYMPNLWRVFLYYAQDEDGVLAHGYLPFPETAQNAEASQVGFGTALTGRVYTRGSHPTKNHGFAEHLHGYI